MNPATVAADIAKLAAKHPEIAVMLWDVAKAALRAQNPWRAVVRKMLRVAAEKASDELANELMGLKKSWE